MEPVDERPRTTDLPAGRGVTPVPSLLPTAVVSFLASLAMMVPLYAAITANSATSQWVWMVIAMLVGLMACVLLEPMGLLSGGVVGTVVASATGPVTYLGWLLLVDENAMGQGDPGVLVGLSAAGIVAIVTTWSVGDIPRLRLRTTLGALLVGFMVAQGLSVSLDHKLSEPRPDAAAQEVLENNL